MPSSGMWYHVPLVRADISEKSFVSKFLRIVIQLLVTGNVVPCSLNHITHFDDGCGIFLRNVCSYKGPKVSNPRRLHSL
jgi:hypothetical protein